MATLLWGRHAPSAVARRHRAGKRRVGRSRLALANRCYACTLIPSPLPLGVCRVRLFAIDVLRCPYCSGPRTLLALLTDGPLVRKILAHLALATEPPVLAPVRAPPEPALAW